MTKSNDLNGGAYRTTGQLRYVAPIAPEAFATILERQTAERVRAALAAGEIAPANEMQAREWLAEKDAAREMESAEIRLREVEAAERAADAAEKSARWAIFAAVISTAALLIAAWPHFAIS